MNGSFLPHLSFLLLGAATLSGCADESHYAALLPRTIEQTNAPDGLVRSVAAAPRRATDAPLRTKIEELLTKSQAAHAAFTTLRLKSAPTIAAAKGARSPSDPWMEGQKLLSALEATRGPSVEAQGALDILYNDSLAHTGMGLDEVVAARAVVTQSLTQEDGQLADLWRALSQTSTGQR